LTIDLDSSQQVLDLSRREADIALRTVRPRGADLVMTKLTTSIYVPLASKSYAAEVRRNKGDAPRWIAWGDAYSQVPAQQWISRHVDPRCIVLKTSAFGAQAAAAASGLGVALLPEDIAARMALVRVKLPRAFAAGLDELPVDDVWLVGHRALRHVPRVAVVWDFIRAQTERLRKRT
jgi:DNA-binding transcriptional LysR family regulator